MSDAPCILELARNGYTFFEQVDKLTKEVKTLHERNTELESETNSLHKSIKTLAVSSDQLRVKSMMQLQLASAKGPKASLRSPKDAVSSGEETDILCAIFDNLSVGQQFAVRQYMPLRPLLDIETHLSLH